MEFETDKWTIKPSTVDKDGVGVFLTQNVNQGELLGTAHMLDPDGFVTGYFSSLGRFHNHSLENPNFQAFVEGGFTRLTALRNCVEGEEVLVNYNDYKYVPNLEIPTDFEVETPKVEEQPKEQPKQKEEQKATPKKKPIPKKKAIPKKLVVTKKKTRPAKKIAMSVNAESKKDMVVDENRSR